MRPFASRTFDAPTHEHAAAADRLFAHSRSLCSRPLTSEEQQRQQILRLLQLGFAESAIARHIEGQRGGPYVAWDAVADMIVLLRQWGFTQKQLDMLLGTGGKITVFMRQPADVEACMRWLQREFGMAAAEVCLACSRDHALLHCSQSTLAGKWQAIQTEYELPEAAMSQLAYALRLGRADFLYYDPATIW